MSSLVSPSHYPVVVVQDRYGGVYSGGAWLAIGSAPDDLDGMPRLEWVLQIGPQAGDVEAASFWAEPPNWIAVGEDPNEAVAKLQRFAT